MDELVSIVIPTYGRAVELRRAVMSAVTQTYRNIEILLVDDNTDENISREVCRVVKEIGDNRIRIVKNDHNLGGALSRNRGIDAAQGRYIAFLDDDDEYLPRKIELQLKKFLESEDTRLALVYCYCDSVNSAREILQHYKNDLTGNCLFEAMKSCIAATTQWMCSKAALEDVGCFSDVPCKQDSTVIIKLLANGYTLDRVPEVLSLYHEEGISRISSGNPQKRIAGEETLRALCRRHYDKLDKKQQREVEYVFACVLIRYYHRVHDRGRFQEALGTIWKMHPIGKRSFNVYYSLLKDRLKIILGMD